jgi:RNA polymerase sigma-70 factor (ECF subfamily)
MFFSEKRTIKNAINGSPVAWEKLVKLHEKKVFNTSMRLIGNREDAMDLTQEVFFEVYRKLSQFRYQSAFSTWLQKISYGKSIDFLRRSRCEVDIEGKEIIEHETPCTHILRRDSNRKILEIFRRLSLEQRLILELKFFQNETFEEISITLNLPQSTVKSRYYAAIKDKTFRKEISHVL